MSTTTENGPSARPRGPQDSAYGVVIGTYDSLHPGRRRFGTQAVELNLAVLRGTCGPDVKILVCDDASPATSRRIYRALCEKYGADFSTNRARMGHSSGDMIVYHKVLRWARRHRLQTVTKLSHRMVIDVPNWVQEDSRSLLASGFATQAQMLANFGLEQIRTECVMMVVDRWYQHACARALSSTAAFRTGMKRIPIWQSRGSLIRNRLTLIFCRGRGWPFIAEMIVHRCFFAKCRGMPSPFSAILPGGTGSSSATAFPRSTVAGASNIDEGPHCAFDPDVR